MSRPTLPWFAHATQSRRRAKELAKNDLQLIEDLVRIRIERGLNQKDVGDLLGVSQQAISKIERPGADPRLSTLRQYSHAIGALVMHAVAADHGQLEESDNWVAISFAPVAREVRTTESAARYAVDARRGLFALAA